MGTTAQDKYIERMRHLFITAFEGGSNYWAATGIELTAEQRDEMKERKEAFSEYIFYLAMEKNHTFKVYDREEEDEVLGKISKAALKKGYSLMKDQYEEHYADVIGENWDANTADVFFQLAIMEDIVFG